LSYQTVVFLLKAIEKLVDRHIRDGALKKYT
jgi:hypothetical protein